MTGPGRRPGTGTAGTAGTVSLTGVKPTGEPHLGNYAGAIGPAVEAAASGGHEGFYFIADHHALTAAPDAGSHRRSVREVAAAWMAAGEGLDGLVLYRQSDVPEVCELHWILSCAASKGLMERAHAYKARVQDNEARGRDRDHGVNVGLYTYPVLMAADILAVGADVVPVGPDQLQHLEIARDVAGAFNHRYGEVLRIPRPLVRQAAAVPGLDGRKMSKSRGNHIPLFAPPPRLRRLVGRIATDSSPPDAPKDPETSTVFAIHRLFGTDAEVEELRKAYARGVSWGEAKARLFEVLDARLAPMREARGRLMADASAIDDRLAEGAARARARASAVLREVRRAVGAGA